MEMGDLDAATGHVDISMSELVDDQFPSSGNKYIDTVQSDQELLDGKLEQTLPLHSFCCMISLSTSQNALSRPFSLL